MIDHPHFEYSPRPEHDKTMLRSPQAEALLVATSAIFANDMGEYGHSDTAHLVSLSGEHTTVSHQIETIGEAEVEEAKTSVSGLFKRAVALFRKTPEEPEPAEDTQVAHIYTLIIPSAHDSMYLGLGVATTGRGNTYAFGTEMSGHRITYLETEDVAKHIPFVLARLAVSERFSKEAIIDARQLKACSTIEGQEATSVYESLQPTANLMLSPFNDSLGGSNFYYIKRRIAIDDTMDDLPVSSIELMRSQFGKRLEIRVIFDRHPITSSHPDARPYDPLAVNIIKEMDDGKETYSVTYRLLHTDHSTEQVSVIGEPARLEPDMRVRIHNAFRKQIRPDNLREEN